MLTGFKPPDSFAIVDLYFRFKVNFVDQGEPGRKDSEPARKDSDGEAGHDRSDTVNSRTNDSMTQR